MASTSTPRTVNWGILATGGIAKTFSKDLSVDPSTRGVNNLTHRVIAAASSSSVSRAEQFLKDVNAAPDAKAYGSYEELVKDERIDAVYVATPHSHHYQNVRLCLQHLKKGKAILCEKAFTVNAKQARILVDMAKEKGIFLMEAVWTRFFPLSSYVRQHISSGTIGTVHRVYADDSMALDPENSYADGKHRLVNLDLAGGALLDLGIYALTWSFQTLYNTLPTSSRRPPSVQASSTPFGPTGADAQTSILLTFTGGQSSTIASPAHALATTSFYVTSPAGSAPCARIQGTKGELCVYGPAHRPERTVLSFYDESEGGKRGEEKEWRQPGPGAGSGFRNGFGDDLGREGEGHGMFWEADEVGRKLLEGPQGGGGGKVGWESEVMGLEESVVIMEVMDEVRRVAGVRYPEKIESVEFPVEL